MIDFLPLSIAAIIGLSMGVIFYGGLYVTITHGLTSTHPALWFGFSFLLRMCLVLLALYFINDGHWQKIVTFFTGFLLAGTLFQLVNRDQFFNRSYRQVDDVGYNNLPIKSVSSRKR